MTIVQIQVSNSYLQDSHAAFWSVDGEAIVAEAVSVR